MLRKKSNPWFVLHLLLAVCLQAVPLPGITIWLMPAWLLMTVTFWILFEPESLHLGYLIAAGILLDVQQGSVLGVHGFALVLSSYIIMNGCSRWLSLPKLQQSLMVVVGTGVYQLLLLLMNGLLGEAILWLWGLVPALTSGLVWPIYQKLLSRIQPYSMD